MIKKIQVAQLRPGMYVHDMNCDWMAHPFLRRSLRIKSDAEIEKISGCGVREVYIDTDKGLDAADARGEAEVRAELEHEMIEMAQKTRTFESPSLCDELAKARKVHGEARRIVHGIMQDVRLGKQIELERVDSVVSNMIGSIFRNKNALLSLCRIKEKDDYTFLHSVSTGALLISFAHALDLDRDVIRQLGVGGLLHDVGKMKIPDELLKKPGSLTEQEFAVMKSHVAHGRDILSQASGITQPSIDVAAQHHERNDGSGYPYGLKGSEISVYGQMASIVDVYDAITSDRCYRKAMEPTDALRKMFEWSKYHFRSELVHAFIGSIGIYPVGTLVRLESGRIGIVLDHRGKSLVQPLVRIIFSAKKGCYLKPEDVDLSRPLGMGGGDRIICHESPAKWQIDVHKFI